MLYVSTLSDKPRLPFMVREDARLDYGFIADLRELVSRRLDRVDPFRESEEYRREQERASRLYGELLGMLSGDGRKLLLAYSEAAAAAHCLETEILAERAFLEGMKMMITVMAKTPDRE